MDAVKPTSTRTRLLRFGINEPRFIAVSTNSSASSPPRMATPSSPVIHCAMFPPSVWSTWCGTCTDRSPVIAPGPGRNRTRRRPPRRFTEGRDLPGVAFVGRRPGFMLAWCPCGPAGVGAESEAARRPARMSPHSGRLRPRTAGYRSRTSGPVRLREPGVASSGAIGIVQDVWSPTGPRRLGRLRPVATRNGTLALPRRANGR